MKKSKSVLLVEDDAIDAMTVRRAFKDLKLTNALDHVTNGEEALEYLRQPDHQPPCVILLDLNMPRADGWDVLQFVQVMEGAPAVVVFTSEDTQAVTPRLMELGVHSVMAKPFRGNELIAKLREAMRAKATAAA
jgi:CheY-like chemotaxis protein